MTVSQEGAADGAARRSNIEAILADYPNIRTDQLEDLLLWFRREASSMDVAMVASNESIREGYSQFRAEHLDRFKARDLAYAAAVVAAVVAVVALIGYWAI